MKKVDSKYLLCSERDLQWGLSIQDAGFQSIGINETYPPHPTDAFGHPDKYLFKPTNGRVLDEYQLVYISRGRGRFVSAHCSEREIHEGNMLLLFPGEWHSYNPDPFYGWDEYWIGFRGVNIDMRINNGFFSIAKPVFDVGLNPNIIDTYQKAIETARNELPGYQQMLAGCVNMLLAFTQTISTYQQAADNAIEKNMKKALLYVRQNFDKNLHPEEVAEYLNWSYSSFRKEFKRFTGRSPYQYILELKILRSRELLTNTDMLLSEIAYAVGFDNADYFSTAFRRCTGMSPSQYRQNTIAK